MAEVLPPSPSSLLGKTPPQPAATAAKRIRRRPEKSKKTMASFQFVNLTETLRHDDDSKTVVRSQAVKSYARETKRARVEISEKRYDGTNESGDLAHLKFRLGPWGLQGRPNPPRKKKASTPTGIQGSKSVAMTQEETVVESNEPEEQELQPDESHTELLELKVPDTLLSYLGVGSIDPFDSLPVPMSPRIHFLLQYSHIHINSSPTMTYPKKKWFWLALKDPAYLNAALSHYSGHLALTHGRGDPTEALAYRMEAIKVVNERLKIPDLAVCDGNIGTVVCIVNYETSNGTLESLRTHIFGLQQMVQLRGGLDQLRSSPYLYRLVSWADLNATNSLSSLPLFPSIDNLFGASPLVGLNPENADTPKLKESLESQNENTKSNVDHSLWNGELSAIFNDLRCLSSIFSRGGDTTTWNTNSMWYSDLLNHVKRRLILHSHLTGDLKTERDAACCNAALILVEICFRGIDINARTVDMWVTRLQESLQLIIPDLGFTKSQPADLRAIFWAVCVGGVAAMRRNEQDWYVIQAASFFGPLNLRIEMDMERTLENILWHDS